jgi:hypothetical protein
MRAPVAVVDVISGARIIIVAVPAEVGRAQARPISITIIIGIVIAARAIAQRHAGVAVATIAIGAGTDAEARGCHQREGADALQKHGNSPEQI